MKEKQTEKTLISEENALVELEGFLKKWVPKLKPNVDIKEEYSVFLDALQSGQLVLDENKVPTYRLSVPINPGGEHEKTHVNFKTRLKPTTRADLADGLNVSKQAAKFSLRLISYIIGEPVAMLDVFDADDYDVISSIAAVFMSGGR